MYEKDYELIQKGIALMYQDKFSRINRNNKKNNMICGNKGNTPVELQETELRKYRKTMWYATIGLKVKSPVYKESTIYVYPTRLGHPLETIPILVVIDDMLKYRVEYGKDVKFGIGGTMFSVNARFTREGHLNVSFFKDSEGDEKNYDYTITKTEGECIPANFGKRIGKDEIYPIKKNIQGGCDYVLFKNTDAESNHEPQIVTSGVIEMDNIKYGVYMDELSIDLIPIE